MQKIEAYNSCECYQSIVRECHLILFVMNINCDIAIIIDVT